METITSVCVIITCLIAIIEFIIDIAQRIGKMINKAKSKKLLKDNLTLITNTNNINSANQNIEERSWFLIFLMLLSICNIIFLMLSSQPLSKSWVLAFMSMFFILIYNFVKLLLFNNLKKENKNLNNHIDDVHNLINKFLKEQNQKLKSLDQEGLI